MLRNSHVAADKGVIPRVGSRNAANAKQVLHGADAIRKVEVASGRC